MKKIYLTKTQQFDNVTYTGSVDPRKLVRMADQSIEVGQTQEDQRPLEKSHILEISKYVGEDRGMLPTSVVVGTKENPSTGKQLTVETETSKDGATLYYMMVPDTEEELKEYANTIDISDGQHRVFAFSDAYRNSNTKDSDVYEVPVTFYIKPLLITRQKLFYTTNAKQKPVPSNLLMWYREQLKMLSKKEEIYFPLVRLMNTENVSPLKDRIIISAEKISKGYKAKELVKIFDRAKIADIGLMTNQQIDNSKLTAILSDYLLGWEKRYQSRFKHPQKETMTKVSGLRYILLLLPTFIELAVNGKEKFDSDFVEKIIKELEEANNVDAAAGETVFSKDPLSFRGETATVKLAEDHAKALKAYMANKQTSGFDIFS